MEFGPRALGARSILGDPRSPTMQKLLNLKVKYRESFRPFAPSVLREHVADWFELDDDSPYMLLVADVRAEPAPADERGRGGAVRHRQAQRAALRDPGGHPRRLFGADPDRARRRPTRATTRCSARSTQRTGCPVLVNTSFNVRGEPIVCTPEDAFRCFMGTEIEVLVAGNCVLRKERQDRGAEARLQGRLRARLSRYAMPRSPARRTRPLRRQRDALRARAARRRAAGRPRQGSGRDPRGRGGRHRQPQRLLLDAARGLRQPPRPARALRPGVPHLLAEARSAREDDAAAAAADRGRRAAGRGARASAGRSARA